MSDRITPRTLRGWLYGDGELALLDVREPGQIAEGHVLFSAPAPYSRFEIDLPRLVPNPSVRMVLCDAGDGVASRAAMRARSMGYERVNVLDGGVDAWAEAGHRLYQGVNVPSKVFGELVERVCRTPHISPAELARMQADGGLVVIDGRTPAEFARMSIPGARNCPNGELALRIDGLAPDPGTTVVVNCAGRTRSIIGAQTLIDLALPNRVVALENGTQGWVLAGFQLDNGAKPVLPAPAGDLPARRERAKGLADRHGVATVDAATVASWLRDPERTTYLLDIRTVEELAADPAAIREITERLAIAHAPGGQLIQATDQWIGIRRARLVVLDNEGVRAPVVASWLARQGHSAAVVDGGIASLSAIEPDRHLPRAVLPDLPRIGATELDALCRAGGATVLDLRTSAAYREGHIPGSAWSIRPGIVTLVRSAAAVLVADEPRIGALAAIDLAQAGCSDIRLLDGGITAWRAGGLPVEATPDDPPDSGRIDFISFTHGRHDGDADASRQYLAWEIGLVDQLDPDERAVLRV